MKYGPFHRWDLYAAASAPSPIYNPATVYPGGRTWLPASPTPVNSEAVNYANWYAGYATRLNAAKTTSGIAFSYLTPQGADPIGYRVGFHNFGEELPPNGAGTGILWVNVKDWDLAQRTAWYNALYGITVSNFKTPTISAMLRIGNLFEKGGSAGGDAAVNPLPAGALDPIDKDSSGAPISCQNNYHILFTDGYTNQIAPTTTVGDRDLNLPPMPPAGVVETAPDLVVTNLKIGGALAQAVPAGRAEPREHARRRCRVLLGARLARRDIRRGAQGRRAVRVGRQQCRSRPDARTSRGGSTSISPRSRSDPPVYSTPRTRRQLLPRLPPERSPGPT